VCAALAVAVVWPTALDDPKEADFEAGLTDDGKGVVITGYTGTAPVVRIPAAIRGLPVREIGGGGDGYSGAFSGNRIVASVIIPAGVTRIGPGAFYNMPRLASVFIREGVTVIGGNAFSGTPLTGITLPKSLQTIGEGAFSGCRYLRTATLPPDMKEIPMFMFRDCGALTAITLPVSITRIGVMAFQNCTNLTAVTIPGSVVTIDISPDAFSGCSKLSPASQAALKKRGFTGSF